MKKTDLSETWLGDFTDADLAEHARDFLQQAKKHQREAAKAQGHADRLRKELRRRARAAKGSNHV